MIKPLHDNVVLKKEKVENKTSSGIILTTESKRDVYKRQYLLTLYIGCAMIWALNKWWSLS